MALEDQPARLADIIPNADSAKDQQELYASMGGKGKFGLVGPQNPFLLSPLLGRDLRNMVDDTRHPDLAISQFGVKTDGPRGQSGQRILEICILYAVRKMRAKFPLQAHVGRGKAVGLTDEQVEALRTEKRPPGLSPEEYAAYDVCQDLLSTPMAGPEQRVGISDPVYARAKQLIGEAGIFEVICICGLYKTLGHIVNGFNCPFAPAKMMSGIGPEVLSPPGGPGAAPGNAEPMGGPPVDRLGPPDTSKMTELATKMYNDTGKLMGKKPNGMLAGPATAFLLAPLLGADLSRTGGHIHSGKLSISRRANETAILIACRKIRSLYGMQAHISMGKQVKLEPEVIEALRLDKRPAKMDPEIEAVYELSHACVAPEWGVPDAIYNKAKAVLGERGVFEVMTIVGFYETVDGMLLNGFRVEGDPKWPDPFADQPVPKL